MNDDQTILALSDERLAHIKSISIGKAHVAKSYIASVATKDLTLISVTAMPDKKILHIDRGEIDETIGGGIVHGFITEISGEAGTGKTQILLKLITNQLYEYRKSGETSVYAISTEGPFPLERMQQMYRLAYAEEPDMRSVQIIDAPEYDLLLDALDRLCTAIDKGSVSHPLVIIDSIAAPLRSAFDSALDRSHVIRKVEKKLRYMSKRNAAVVVANQVAGLINDRQDVLSAALKIMSNASISPQHLDGSFSAQVTTFLGSLVDARDRIPAANTVLTSILTDGDVLTPALGLVWSTCIDVRICLRRIGGPDSKTVDRELAVMYSPICPCGWQNRVRYIIDGKGVSSEGDIPDSTPKIH